MNVAHPILGIDVGKDSFVVSFPPSEPKTPPRQYPTMLISYDDPRWWVSFLDLIDETAVIAAEPTGGASPQPHCSHHQHLSTLSQLVAV